MKSFTPICVFLCAFSVEPLVASSWSPLPVFGGGTVLNALIAPSDPTCWYAFSDVCGPYRSSNGGESWTALHARMPLDMRGVRADEVRDLSIDPRNADSFVMVGGRLFETPGGAYVSRDGGRTFRRTLKARFYGDANRRRLGRCIARNPANPDVIVCGEDWDGLFRSDDNGETWHSIGLERTWITDIRWDTDNPGCLYACAPDLPVGDRGADYQRESGFFRSDDGGATWLKLSAESPLELTQMAGSPRLVGIFDDGLTAPAGGRFVRVSDDGGATWRSFGEGLPVLQQETPPSIHHDFARFQSLAAGPGFWLVGNGPGDIFRRGRNDTAWAKVERLSLDLSDPVAESQLQSVADRGEMWALASITIDPHDPAHWLATDWFEIWETRDAGHSWRSRVNGLANVVPFCVSCDPNSPDNIAYGIADMGMSCSHDGGRTFHAVPQTGGANTVAWCRRNAGVAFATGGKYGTQFLRTRDGGQTWTGDFPKRGLPSIPSGGNNASGRLRAFTVAVDPTTDDVYLCVGGPASLDGGGVWVSHDLGDSFERFSVGLPDGDSLFKTSEFSGGGGAGWPSELVFGADGSAVLATWDGTCYFLDRNAGAWRTTSIENRRINFTIAADPHEPGRFLMAQSGTLRESTDGGRTWHVLATGDWVYNGIAFDAHMPGLVALPSRDCIRISRDGGRTFGEVLPDGYAFPTGDKRWVSLDRGRLFGLTRGSGVWMRSIVTDADTILYVNCDADYKFGENQATAEGKLRNRHRKNDRLVTEGAAGAFVCKGTTGTGTANGGYFYSSGGPAATWESNGYANSDFTFEVFVRADLDATLNWIANHQNAWRLGWSSSGRIQLRDKSGTLVAESARGMNSGQWHHVAVVQNRTAGTMSLYIDYHLAGSKAYTVTAGASDTNDLVIGAWSWDGEYNYANQSTKCAYDELRIVKRALQPRDFLFQRVVPVDADTVAYMSFDSTSNAIYDIDLGPNALGVMLGAYGSNSSGISESGTAAATLYPSARSQYGFADCGGLSVTCGHNEYGGFGYSFSDSGGLVLTNSFTAETFAKFTSAPAPYYGWVFYQRGGMSTSRCTWGLFLQQNGTLGCRINNSAVELSATNLLDNTWHHLAAVYDAAQGVFSIYLDHVIHGRFGGVSFTTDDKWLFFGGKEGGIGHEDEAWQGVNGALYDELRITKRALKPTEFITPESIVGLDPILFARFEDGCGAMVSGRYAVADIASVSGAETDPSAKVSREIITLDGHVLLADTKGLALTGGTVAYPGNGVFDLDAATAEFFVKASSGGADDSIVLFAVAGASSPVWRLSANGAFIFRTASDSLTVHLGIGDGRWHHIAVAYTPSGADTAVNVYLDHSLAATQTLAGAPAFGAGAGFTLGSAGFSGAIDELRLREGAPGVSGMLYAAPSAATVLHLG